MISEIKSESTLEPLIFSRSYLEWIWRPLSDGFGSVIVLVSAFFKLLTSYK